MKSPYLRRLPQTCSTRNVLKVSLVAALTGSAAQALIAAELPAAAAERANERASVRAAMEPGERSPARRTVSYSLDGVGNNVARPMQGAADTPYRRLAPANYADGIGEMVAGPGARYISNRIFEDLAQNLFSENGVTQWAYNWGQFIDHTIGLREQSDEPLAVRFDADDPLEFFANDSETLRATRSAVMPGSGESGPREQLNTVSSYIDAWAVYGGSEERLEWLREGPVDGDLSNNGARLLLTEDGYLPRANERGDAASAPEMERQGQLLGAPDVDERLIVAGDQRANENIALTAVQTLFAREHNRIVDELPPGWPERWKFEAARRLVVATQQYITYEEFLPALGVQLDAPSGYRSDVDPSVTNEFSTVGYRAHSMIHGEIEMETETARYDEGQLELFRSKGIEVEVDGEEIEIAVPLNVAFGHPQLVTQLGLGPLAKGLGGEPQYKNDEQLDNQIRSVLFKIPGPDVEDPDTCLDGPTLNECFALVGDVGVLDIVRGRDHGMPYYNDLREAYGLSRVSSFAELTGEASEEFPTDDPKIDTENPIDDPDILEFVELFDADGNELELGSEEADAEAVTGVRRTTLAARLKAVYGDVDRIDAFVGMVSEPHLAGTEFGELQHAMWKREFEALRDGDRNFYAWNRELAAIDRSRGASEESWKRTLAEVILDNTDLEPGDIQANMFIAAEDEEGESEEMSSSESAVESSGSEGMAEERVVARATDGRGPSPRGVERRAAR